MKHEHENMSTNPAEQPQSITIAGRVVKCLGCPVQLRITISGVEPICSECQGKLDAEAMCPKCYCEGGINFIADDHGDFTPGCTYCGYWLRLERFGGDLKLNYDKLGKVYTDRMRP